MLEVKLRMKFSSDTQIDQTAYKSASNDLFRLNILFAHAKVPLKHFFLLLLLLVFDSKLSQTNISGLLRICKVFKRSKLVYMDDNFTV